LIENRRHEKEKVKVKVESVKLWNAPAAEL
jgi:hypothetical protein